MNHYYVYARRRGPWTTPRPLVGPLATHSQAVAVLDVARTLAVEKHYLSEHSDVVYVGPASPAMGGRPGLLNPFLSAVVVTET